MGSAFFLSIKVNGTAFSFPKSEKVTSRKTLDVLFQNRDLPSVSAFPLRLVWLSLPLHEIASQPESTHQAVFMVPKRKFKRAHDRNRIRRLMRETYRLQKHNFPLLPEKKFALLFIYLSHEMVGMDAIKLSFDSLIEKWKKSLTM